MQYLKKIAKKLTFEKIILLCHMIITLIIVLNHEPWRDEGQAWLIAKNLSIPEIINQMQYEGHPCLWHLLLVPFAKLNFPYRIINIISWIIGCISTTIIIKKSPFSKYTNTAIVLSMPILYYYTVVSRSYCLILLFIAILMHLYPKRKEKPILYGIIIALLTNTHILICGLIGILMLKDLYELFSNKKENYKKRILGFSIEILGVILLILQLFLSLSSNAESQNFINLTLLSPLNSLTNILKITVNDNFITFLTLTLSFFGILIGLFKQKFIFITLVISTIFIIMVDTFIYRLNIQHVGIFILTIIFCCHLSKKENNKKIEGALLIFLASTIPYSIYLSFTDITSNFTNSKNTANYIIENIPKGTTFLCISDDIALSIVPYLEEDYQFISHNTEKKFTFITWSAERHQEKTYYDIKDIIEENNIKYVIHSLEKNNFATNRLKEYNYLKTIATFNDKNIIEMYEEYEILKVIKE